MGQLEGWLNFCVRKHVKRMKRKLPVINFLLILILFLLLGWGVQSWLQPKFPSKVQGDQIVPAPRELEVPSLSRQVYSNTMVRDVSRLNLFRKQRTKYYRPKPPKPKPRIKPELPEVAVAPPPPPPKPTAPPPQLILTGVMLLADQKVAIFEGTYSEIRGGELVQNLKPRRRGYKIGETLGGYEIKAIDRSHVTLSAITGNNLTLTISKTPSTQKIKKTRNKLVHKSKPVANSIKGKSPIRRTRRSQPIPTEQRPLNRQSPTESPPPVVSTPGAVAPAPNPADRNRLPGLRQRSMGF